MGSSTDQLAIRIPGEQAHAPELDAQPFGDELCEARLVSLTRRLRPDHHVDEAVRCDGDLGTLSWRPGRDLDVVGYSDPAVPAAPPCLLPARREALPVGQREGTILHRDVVAAVLDDAEGIRVRHAFALDQIAPTQLDTIESVTARGEIDQALHDEHHLGTAGASIRR